QEPRNATARESESDVARGTAVSPEEEEGEGEERGAAGESPQEFSAARPDHPLPYRRRHDDGDVRDPERCYADYRWPSCRSVIHRRCTHRGLTSRRNVRISDALIIRE